MISTFFLISQSLRTGEPLHEAQFKNLADRLHYHGSYAHVASAGTGMSPHTVARNTLRQALTDYEYMAYASAVVGVLQLAHVSSRPPSPSLALISCTRNWRLTMPFFAESERAAHARGRPRRRGPARRVRGMEGHIRPLARARLTGTESSPTPTPVHRGLEYVIYRYL